MSECAQRSDLQRGCGGGGGLCSQRCAASPVLSRLAHGAASRRAQRSESRPGLPSAARPVHTPRPSSCPATPLGRVDHPRRRASSAQPALASSAPAQRPMSHACTVERLSDRAAAAGDVARWCFLGSLFPPSLQLSALSVCVSSVRGSSGGRQTSEFLGVALARSPMLRRRMTPQVALCSLLAMCFQLSVPFCRSHIRTQTNHIALIPPANAARTDVAIRCKLCSSRCCDTLSRSCTHCRGPRRARCTSITPR